MPSEPAPPLSAAINRLWLPRADLSACVRGTMTRSTLGLALSDAQRFNHYLATPLCSIGWMFEGSTELLPSHAPAEMTQPRVPLPGRITFSGPFTRPSVSWNPGPAHGMMLMLMPDALHRLTGLDVTPWVNRVTTLDEALPADCAGEWQAMAERVLALPDDAARVAAIEDFLGPRWQAARPAQPALVHRYQDWAHALALRAATSAPGRSLRQVERRIKQWSGLPMRELRGMGRVEQAFFAGLAMAEAEGHPNWAELAGATGYADQSHLCRETRRLTGFAPDELYRRIQQDEGFWSYRVWM
jgi:AraC-like DNA-binding protein